MRGFEARVIEDAMAWQRDVVWLAVRDGDRHAYLMPDGTWTVNEDETAMPAEPIGIAMPKAAIEAIAVAIQQWQGHTSHADTEARVLREWLTVERERVDRVLVR